MEIKSTEWNLKNFFNPEDFPKQRETWKQKTKEFVDKWSSREDYLEDPEILLEALEEYNTWSENFGTVADEYYYYHLMNYKNQLDNDIKAAFNKVQHFSVEIANEIQFFLIRVSKIKDTKKFLEHPKLQKYKHLLENLFESAKYVLTEPEEKIMNLKSHSSYDAWVDMILKFLSDEERKSIGEDGKKETRSYQALIDLMRSPKKEVRDEAAKQFNDILKNNVKVAESEINAILHNKKINDELRGYSRPDEARHIGDDIETEIVDTVINTIEEHHDISKEYYKLKAQLLGQEKLEYHERTVAYGQVDKEYSYEDSIKLVHKVFSKLDKKFSDYLESFLKNSQIDVYPAKGKIGGAWCFSALKTQPTFIIVNHANKLQNITTIAHELGHAINHEMIAETQPGVYTDSTLATAEVASTFMEDFVLQELLAEADDETKLSLLMERLDSDISSIIRQPALYRFERDLHEKFRELGYIPKEEIGKLFQKNMASYMGDYVEQSKGSENWWVYIPHIREFFYVYSYASGLLISKAMQRMVKEDPKNIEKVKEFLAAGTSKSPKDIFASIGIDISKKEFWESGLQEVKDLLEETKELAKKLGKI